MKYEGEGRAIELGSSEGVRCCKIDVSLQGARSVASRQCTELVVRVIEVVGVVLCGILLLPMIIKAVMRSHEKRLYVVIKVYIYIYIL